MPTAQGFKKFIKLLRNYYFALPRSFRFPFQSACQAVSVAMVTNSEASVKVLMSVFLFTLIAQITLHVSKLKE